MKKNKSQSNVFGREGLIYEQYINGLSYDMLAVKYEVSVETIKGLIKDYSQNPANDLAILGQTQLELRRASTMGIDLIIKLYNEVSSKLTKNEISGEELPKLIVALANCQRSITETSFKMALMNPPQVQIDRPNALHDASKRTQDELKAKAQSLVIDTHKYTHNHTHKNTQ